MAEKRTVTRLEEGVSLIRTVEFECGIWLVEGSDAALLIDTGLGAGDLRAEVEALLGGKPYKVVNTHGHGDHSGGNYRFDAVYMHSGAKEEADLAFRMTERFVAAEELPAIKQRMAERPTEQRFVKEGDLFELGGRTLEVIETPGHTTGDITLFDRDKGLLFCGDSMVKVMDILLVFPHTASVAVYAESMRKLAALEGVRGLCTGHDRVVMPREFMLDCLACAEDILAGAAETEEAKCPIPGIEGCLRARHGEASILFRNDKIR